MGHFRNVLIWNKIVLETGELDERICSGTGCSRFSTFTLNNKYTDKLEFVHSDINRYLLFQSEDFKKEDLPGLEKSTDTC